MTQEERKLRIAERQAKLRELKLALPEARIDSFTRDGSGVVLDLDPGDLFLHVRKRGDWSDDSRFPGEWQYMMIRLDDPEPLIEFIRALVGRYNWLVDELNRQAAGCGVKTLAKAGK